MCTRGAALHAASYTVQSDCACAAQGVLVHKASNDSEDGLEGHLHRVMFQAMTQ